MQNLLDKFLKSNLDLSILVPHLILDGIYNYYLLNNHHVHYIYFHINLMILFDVLYHQLFFPIFLLNKMVLMLVLMLVVQMVAYSVD